MEKKIQPPTLQKPGDLVFPLDSFGFLMKILRKLKSSEVFLWLRLLYYVLA